MVKQQRRADRRFVPAAGHSVPQVRFPVVPVQRRQPSPHQVKKTSPAAADQLSGRKWAGPKTGSADSQPHCSSSTTTTEEERAAGCGDLGPDGGSGELKRARLDGAEASCDQTGSDGSSTDGVMASRAPPPDQQEAAEHSEESRAAELQSVGSLKVTIQQSSESREFGQTDRTGGLHCHVCNLTCCSLQVFHEHMSGTEHVKRLQEITHSICLNTHTLQDRGSQPDVRRWCDTCQTHFSGDIIIHRRTKQHKMCKQLCRPFCPVCRRHFRTPRKFVEHMKSPEHKQQVQLQEAQEEELITVDAVGCFQEEEGEEGEEEEEEEEEEAEVVDDQEEEEDVGKQTADTEEYDPLCSYGSSFVVPVSGFLCRLCNKFFQRETTARHTHCRTRTHYLNLQRAQTDGRTTTDHHSPAPT